MPKFRVANDHGHDQVLEVEFSARSRPVVDHGRPRQSIYTKRRRQHHVHIIEVTEFKSEVICDLRGCQEADIASKATKMVVKVNMKIDPVG